MTDQFRRDRADNRDKSQLGIYDQKVSICIEWSTALMKRENHDLERTNYNYLMDNKGVYVKMYLH